MHHYKPDTACACTTLRKASRAVTRLYDEALGETGMTIVQFSVLRNIAREGEPPLMRLAELLLMDRTSLYRTLKPLEREGWIAIRDGKGRAKTTALTAAGREALDTATGPWIEIQERLMGAIGMEDLAATEAALRRLAQTAAGLAA